MKPRTYHVIRQLERRYQNPTFEHECFYLGPDHIWEPVRINELISIHCTHSSLPSLSPPHPSAYNTSFLL